MEMLLNVGSPSSQPRPRSLGLAPRTQACPDPGTLLGPTGLRSQRGQDAPKLLTFRPVLGAGRRGRRGAHSEPTGAAPSAVALGAGTACAVAVSVTSHTVRACDHFS